MAYKLREEEEEMSPSSRLAVDYDIILTPSGKVEDAFAAFEDINNYGIYKSNLRKEQAIEDHYGPTTTTKGLMEKKFKEFQKEYDNEDERRNKFIETFNKVKNIEQKYNTLKSNNGNFYPKTSKAEMDKFIEQNKSNRKLVTPKVKGNTLVFPKGENPSKELTKKYIKTVMDNAGIDYKISEKEVSESIMTKSKLKEIIKSEIRSLLK
jgi:hypothetical protein